MSRFRSWAPPGAPIERPSALRNPFVTLHVFSEGACTEIGWLAHLERAARTLNIRFESRGGVGVPSTVVNAAIEKRREIQRMARTKEVYRRDEVWAIVDRDDHDLSQALRKASDAGVGLVFSNACFELWPLLHREDISAHKERNWLQRRLKAVHSSYDHDNGAQVDWASIGSPSEATRRALELHFRSPDPTTWGGATGEPAKPKGALSNPTTSAWLFHRRCVDSPHAPQQLLDLGQLRNHDRVGEVLPVLEAMLAEPTRSAARAQATTSPHESRTLRDNDPA